MHKAERSQRSNKLTETDGFTSTPTEIDAGRSTKIKFTLQNCLAAWADRELEIKDASKDDLLLEGITFNSSSTITVEGVGQCSFTLDFFVAKPTVAKLYKFEVRAKDVNGAAYREISVLVKSTTVPERGPIPPGMTPSVDVMWAVVPKKIVNDNYGGSIANRFYCLEVVIGNNSGYDLQIGAVGFKVGPIGSHATTMAEIQKRLGSQQNSRIQGFDDKLNATLQNCKKNDPSSDGYAECVRTSTNSVLAEFVNESKRTLDLVSELNRTETALSRLPFKEVLPVSSYVMARGSASHGQFWNWRDLLLNIGKAVGPVLTGSNFLFAASSQLRFSNWTNLFSNPIVKGYESVFPDEVIPRLQRLDDQVLRDGMIISNNRQIRTRTFVPKELLKLDRKYRDDPVVITQALGSLVIVGDTIEYVNRISVTSSPSGEVIPPPTVVSSRDSFYLGEKAQFVISGNNLGGTTQIDAPSGIKATVMGATKTSVDAKIEVDESVEPGDYKLILKADGGTAIVPIRVKQPSAELELDGTFAIDSNQQNKVVTPGTDAIWTIKGRFLRNTRLKAIGNDNRIAIDPLSYRYIDGQTLEVKVSIPLGIKDKVYQFELVPAPGVSSGAKNTIELIVGKPTPPSIADVTWGEDGSASLPVFDPINDTKATIRIIGSNLLGGQLTVEPDSVKVTASEKKSSSLLMSYLTIPKGLKNFKIKVTDQYGQPSGVLTINLGSQPDIIISSPSTSVELTVEPGSKFSLNLVGENLGGLKAQFKTAVTGWSIGEIAETSSSGKTATITIVAPAADVFSTTTEIILVLSNTSEKAVEIKIRASPVTK